MGLTTEKLTAEQAVILSADALTVSAALRRARQFASEQGLLVVASYLATVEGAANAEANRLCEIANVAPVCREPSEGDAQ